jgi:hypothetical protein
LERAFLSSETVRIEIIEKLKKEGVSISVKDGIVTFKKDGHKIKRGYGLLHLDSSDVDDDNCLHCEDYVECVVKYILLTLQEKGD